MVRALRGFLSLTGYYRKFIKDYDIIVAPVTKLLKRKAFSWGPTAEAAFKTIFVIYEIPKFTINSNKIL
ncbi:hypothetical protein E2562_025502 [Oryza meyeriana var. granulata]|uniref:Reverse transcriptase/retrotransposon-derived protein RNase H-like domain-containing protein n=1 Tax=Oryza meyeriana var. granulata TaxID=110450 RepID=A0A6G1CIB7_9ORYZ|nr:hypothetical protein E2562_025502 [Oryza meyeriana var. granulata]